MINTLNKGKRMKQTGINAIVQIWITIKRENIKIITMTIYFNYNHLVVATHKTLSTRYRTNVDTHYLCSRDNIAPQKN